MGGYWQVEFLRKVSPTHYKPATRLVMAGAFKANEKGDPLSFYQKQEFMTPSVVLKHLQTNPMPSGDISGMLFLGDHVFTSGSLISPVFDGHLEEHKVHPWGEYHASLSGVTYEKATELAGIINTLLIQNQISEPIPGQIKSKFLSNPLVI